MTTSGAMKLRAAVIQQACLDFMKGWSDNQYDKFSRGEVTCFLLSQDFDLYADEIDGRVLLDELNRRVKAGKQLNISLSH